MQAAIHPTTPSPGTLSVRSRRGRSKRVFKGTDQFLLPYPFAFPFSFLALHTHSTTHSPTHPHHSSLSTPPHPTAPQEASRSSVRRSRPPWARASASRGEWWCRGLFWVRMEWVGGWREFTREHATNTQTNQPIHPPTYLPVKMSWE